ncbi:MAG: FkbM family methyltransferase [Nostocales cyanobacterium LacPavin_0920_SED1_MAG_38_18]|nr:FkbM family methyltransferase [Nostocales cyanobacterium LacPavin_0920_SED1_MAG_38_18]
MLFISYAQNFEDVLLNRVFKDKLEGFYIDVGAFHPTSDSVTKAFYDRGWTGINIEPMQFYYKLLRQERPKDINLNIALSDSEGILNLFEVVGRPGNSTLNKEIAYKIAQENDLEVYQHTISVKTLASICEQYVNQEIDFLKIDVEGLEEQVILGADWEKFRPTILVIESTIPNTNIRREDHIFDFLNKKGYQKVFFDGINDYYITEESNSLAKYFSFPVNILDQYIDHRLLSNQYANLDNNEYSSESSNDTKIKIALEVSILGLGTRFSWARTGIYRVTENLLKGLLKSPLCEVYLCTSLPEVFYPCQVYINKNALGKKLYFVSELENKNIDIYHSTHDNPLPNFPVRIVTLHDLIPLIVPGYANATRIEKTIKEIDKHDFVSCISQFTKQDLVNYKQEFDNSQVLVTYLAADKERFYPCNQQELLTKTKQKYQIPNQPYILTLSNLEPRKNIAHVIRCFVKLIKNTNIDDLNLVLIGTKVRGYKEILTEIDNAEGLKHRIIVTGYVPDEDLAPLYSGALAFAYLSIYEGFGLPPLEALQCGTPVITSNTSSLPEVVGDAGIMLDPHDETGLCNAIFKLYSEPEYRENLAQKSLKQAQKFSWERYIQDTIKIYELAAEKAKTLPHRNILIDGVFFQIRKSGISRVWQSLLEAWSKTDFSDYILVLDRDGTAPQITGIRYLNVAGYNYNDTDGDKKMLQELCDKEGVEVFISSYYTTPLNTPSVFLAYDMIPELIGLDLDIPMWREKHTAIEQASAYVAISENTARDLVRYFTDISLDSVVIANTGVDDKFFNLASIEEISEFKSEYKIQKPYFLLIGSSNDEYKNILLFFQAFAQLENKHEFDIVCTGTKDLSHIDFQTYTKDSQVHLLELEDEELAIAYSGAIALVYPSKYEGFGLPIIEAMSCGCPVITCPNASIPEAAGEAAIYVNDDDIEGMANALSEIQKLSVRRPLIAAGFKQIKQFSWQKMADTVRSVLLNTTLLRLDLRKINHLIFPNWSQAEELIASELKEVIKSVAINAESIETTLLIDTTGIDIENAKAFLSSVKMNLLLHENLDASKQLKISLIGKFNKLQWQTLIPHITSIIHLENENNQAITNYNEIVEQTNQCNLVSTQNSINLEHDSINTLVLTKCIYDVTEKYKLSNSNLAQLDSFSFVTEELSNLRKEIAEYLMGIDVNQLEKLYTSTIGEAHQMLVSSSIQYESLLDIDNNFLTEILANQHSDSLEAIRNLLVLMLYYRPYELPLNYDLNIIPHWLLQGYLQYALQKALCFQKIGEPDNYYEYITSLVNNIYENITRYPNSDFWISVGNYFTSLANFGSLYFTDKNLKDIYAKRADIMQLVISQQFEDPLEYDFSERSLERNKIRLGIISLHFNPQTEIFATLPVYKNLNRDLFEVILFTLNTNNHRLERYCFGHADKVIEIPRELDKQIERIREADLDILFVGTNLTFVTHPITILALHRLARIQILDANSPVSTGMRHIDYYISSKLSEPEYNAQDQYTETLIKLDCPPQCFDFATEAQTLHTELISRSDLAINENTIVYISGANYNKIIPELEETWAKILANVPNSVLLLYPFNPNWSSFYPKITFWKRIVKTFAKYGLDEDRLIILESAPNRGDVEQRLKMADIYLDAYPYSGMTSLLDPLQAGLPTVVRQGESSRSKKGASLLRELKISDLVANSEESYIQLAVALGKNPKLRQQKSDEIKAAMANNPSFLDSRSYSTKMGNLFQELFRNYLLQNLEQTIQFREINLIIFPDWTKPEDELGFELQQVIQSLATHPENEKINLIIHKGNITAEDAEIFLSSVAMNLLMEDLDISDTISISLLDKLGYLQWQSLLPFVHGRIVLDNEDKQAVEEAPVTHLKTYQLIDSLIKEIPTKQSIRELPKHGRSNTEELNNNDLNLVLPAIQSLLQLSKNGQPNINELNLVLRDMKSPEFDINNHPEN